MYDKLPSSARRFSRTPNTHDNDANNHTNNTNDTNDHITILIYSIYKALFSDAILDLDRLPAILELAAQE